MPLNPIHWSFNYADWMFFCCQVWSSTKGHEVGTLSSSSPLNCVTFDPEDHLLAAGCWNGNVIVWNWLQNKTLAVSCHEERSKEWLKRDKMTIFVIWVWWLWMDWYSSFFLNRKDLGACSEKFEVQPEGMDGRGLWPRAGLRGLKGRWWGLICHLCDDILVHCYVI